ncbi:hypothetical protein [Nocardia amikacinitolerans]|uniref:hypothetical protein n=1 Tax=Nocardia amikacinitolerans TaxID=756689 RepID=UPI0020A2B142|nr:hypothetical protein [Nocardia amikacinitolerans]
MGAEIGCDTEASVATARQTETRVLWSDALTGQQLSDATVQDIQLELIRRASFNGFYGERIATSLERRRDLWIAVCMDRLGSAWSEHRDWLPASSLIKLRDLRGNRWNVDTIFVLTEDTEMARRLAEVADTDSWDADEVLVQDNAEEIGAALGTGRSDYGLLTAWWD